MEHSLNDVLVELHVPDFGKAKAFYGKFGFEIVWERLPDADKGYLVMKRGNSVLCFWPGTDFASKHLYFQEFPADTPRGYGVELVVMVENLDELYVVARDAGAVVEDMKVQPWGLRDFRIIDPFGYYLRLTTPHNILDSGNAIPD